MKRIIVAVLMIALLATASFAAYRNVGYELLAAGTGTTTIDWDGSARGLSVYAESQDLTFVLLPDRSASWQGSTFTVRAGTTITITDTQINGVEITRTSATVAEVLWW
jgi:hypothetical protein